MKNFFLIALIDIKESFRSRWFLIYIFTFVCLVCGLLLSGVSNSRVSGFVGLSRILLLFIQICFIILPIFILITTVRSICYDRDMNTLEYLLSYPVSLKEYYFGKATGRAFIVISPLILSLLFMVIFAIFSHKPLELKILFVYTVLLCILSFFFLSLGFFISVIVKSQEMALGIAFFIWLFLIAFLDLALIGFMMKISVNEYVIYLIAILNPIEAFRIASISLFDPNLSVIGPAAYYVLDIFGRNFFILYSICYSLFLGFILLICGYLIFCKKDLT